MIWKITLPCNKVYTLPIAPSNYSELVTYVTQRYHSPSLGNFSLKYIDIDGDLVNLNNEDDFQAAVVTGDQEQLHILQVLICQDKLLKDQSKRNPAPLKHVRTIQQDKNSSTPKTAQEKGRTALIKDRLDKNVVEKVKRKSRSLSQRCHRSLSCKKRARQHCGEHTSLEEFKEELHQKYSNFISNLISEETDCKVQEIINNLAPKFLNAMKDLYREKTHHATCGLSSHLKRYQEECFQCKMPAEQLRKVCVACLDKHIPQKSQQIENSPKLRPKAETFSYTEKRSIKVMSRTKTSKTDEKGTKYNPTFCYQSLRRNLTKKEYNSYKASISMVQLEQCMNVSSQDPYKLKLEIYNCGEVKWPQEVKLVCVNGFNKGKENPIPSLNPGRRANIEVPLQAPEAPGKYLSQWRICHGTGDEHVSFGKSLFEEIHVPDTDEDRKAVVSVSFDGEEKGFEILNESIKKSSERAEHGRQCQESSSEELEIKVCEKEDYLEKVSLNGGELIEKIRCHEDRMKCAKFLDEIFPGDYEEKLDFLYGMSEQSSMHDVLENYLMLLGRAKCQLA